MLKAPGAELWFLSDAGRDTTEAINALVDVEIARRSGIPHVIYISDACRSNVSGILNSVIGGNIFPILDVPDTYTDVDIFFATRPGDPALEVEASDQEGYGIFTECLLSAVTQPIPEIIQTISDAPNLQRRVVTSRKLKPVIIDSVNRRAESIGITLRQSPEVRAETDLPQFFASLSESPSDAEPETGDSSQRDPEKESTGLGEGASKRGSTNPGADPIDFWLMSNAEPARVDPIQIKTDLSRSLSAQTLLNRNGLLWDFAQSIRQDDGARDPFAYVAVYGDSIGSVEADGYQMINVDISRNMAVAVLAEDWERNRPVTGVVRLGNGRGTLVSLMPGVVAQVLVENGRITSLRHVPTDAYEDGTQPLEQFTALAYDEALQGQLRRVYNTLYQFLDFNRPSFYSLRVGHEFNELDAMALYAGAEKGQFDFETFRQALGRPRISFDVALMPLRYDMWFSNESEEDTGSISANELLLEENTRIRISPFAPTMTRGWLMFSEKSPLHFPAIKELKKHLIPSLWTTFDAEGTDLAIQAISDERRPII